MAILRHSENAQKASEFQRSINQVPEAMSMMIDSMVNMLQSTKEDKKVSLSINEANQH